ncbi:hypothetical protein NDU88_001792 [Pleurodeles waltl]|uniref:Uncharacterized protein n=1 Tax=Pleurodeles waltl TaxID=8319 RepID=A0AAV7W1I0_PLEWA|nr:hypothetical protein NDU88_001792 [Pleurodeles waltl]
MNKKFNVSDVPGDYKVGDWVRVVKGAWTAKGESKFSEPLEVRKVYRYAMLLSDGNVWNYGKVIRVPGGGNREKLPDLGRKSGNSVGDKTSTSESSLCKSGREGVKGVCSILWILFLAPCEDNSDVSARGIESRKGGGSAEESGGCGVSVSSSRLSLELISVNKQMYLRAHGFRDNYFSVPSPLDE